MKEPFQWTVFLLRWWPRPPRKYSYGSLCYWFIRKVRKSPHFCWSWKRWRWISSEFGWISATPSSFVASERWMVCFLWSSNYQRTRFSIFQDFLEDGKCWSRMYLEVGTCCKYFRWLPWIIFNLARSSVYYWLVYTY